MEGLIAIEKNSMWEIMDFLEPKIAINMKWVSRIKFLVDGSIQNKAQLVAKEYTQQHGIDFGKIFSLVACFKTMRSILVLVV